MKNFNLICAVSLDGIIGDSHANCIPWYLPSDLRHFKELTTGHTVVMGSRTHESIGKALPNRRNVVISRSGNIPLADETYPSFHGAFMVEKEGFFVIGGEHIYGEALKHSPLSLYITIVNATPNGDVRFPISGRRFLQDEVTTSTGLKYNCISRSEWQKENDIEFQFTEFRFYR